MAGLTLADAPLICTPEIAKAIFAELTLDGRVEATDEVASYGALWQRKRLVLHLETALKKVEALLAEMDRTSAEYAKDKDHPLEGNISAKIRHRGRLEGQIKALQELISVLS